MILDEQRPNPLYNCKSHTQLNIIISYFPTYYQPPSVPAKLDMFPLPLLPTVPDELDSMSARRALPFQNAFMKNALIRSLNVIYELAPKAKPSHPSFGAFMEYIEMVCEMICTHVKGDEYFFNSLAKHCSDYRPKTNKYAAAVQDSLDKLRGLAGNWRKDGKTYHHNRLQGLMAGMDESIIGVFHKRLPEFSADALPQSIQDEKLGGLIQDNIIWLASHSDVSILLPFCMSHHDTETSKYWPSIPQDAVKVLPSLVNEHPNFWQFAPFDPISRSAKKCPM